MSDFSANRLVGLDIVRGGAIMAVLFAHARYLVEAPEEFLFLTITGKFGVELFFVLSGFLIGAILIRACERELSARSLLRFWTRRWLRTLPAYFAVLLFVWAVFGKVSPYYFFFLQDLVLGSWSILPISWTLVIEEWFYLLFPPTCFVLIYFSPRWGFFIAALMLLLTSVMLMFDDYSVCAAANNSLDCFARDIRKYTFRFTSLGMGAMLAYVNHRWGLRELLSSRLTSMKWATLVVVGFVLLFCGDTILNHPGSVPVAWAFALFYPLMGFGSMFIVALMFVWEPKPAKSVANFFTYASVTSYSCYLWHMMINQQLKVWLVGWNQWLLVALFFVLALAAGGVSYLIVENPFLRMRDRLAS